MNTLKIWKHAPHLHYDLGYQFQDELQDAGQAVIQELTRNIESASRPVPLVLLPSATDYANKLKALQWLQARGRVTQIDSGSCEWYLSEDGRSSFRISTELVEQGLALTPVVGRADEDKHIFELMWAMWTRGWRCFVRSCRAHRKKKMIVAEPVLQDYKHGDEKVWWVKDKQETILKTYLLCLLSAEKHHQPVPHFRSSAFYASIMEGRPPPARRKKKTDRFQFEKLQDFDEHVESALEGHVSKPPARKRVAVAKSALPSDGSPEERDSQDASSEEEESSSGEDDGPQTSRGASEVSSQEGSSNRSNSSSSSSSSTSGIAEALAEVLAAPSMGGGGEGRQHGGGRLLETTTYWRGCKFTHINKQGVHCGYEVSCYIESHNISGKCTRTRSWKTHGGENALQRKLKAWVIAGHTVQSKQEHMAMPDLSESELPTLEALDRCVVEEQVMVVLAKRRTRS